MSKGSFQGGETPTPPRRSDVDSNADTAVSDAATASGEMAKAVPPDGAPAKATAPDTLIGTVLSERYKVTKKIGQGGMGAVYEAQHMLIGKRVAVKVLLDKYAEKDQVVARLEQEAKLASSIGHANIIDITDFGRTIDGRTYVVMEYLEGESLGALIGRSGAIDPDRAMRIAKQVASALTAAHEKGVIHRDVKPENVFLVERSGEDFVKVVDFGISKSIAGDADEVKLTQTGMVLGTPLYMSPEQARGDEELDHRIDIYALGVILYEMITGEVPFQGTNYLNILSQVISEDPPAPTKLNPRLDRDLEDVIMKAMAKEPDHRYPTMAKFNADLSVLIGDGDTRSTGARITAARWRRKKQRRSALQVVSWVAVLAVVATGVIFSVSTLMESKETAAVAPAPPPLAPEPAAEPVPEPAVADPDTFELEITSDPPGAIVFHESRQLGPSPVTIAVERRSGDMKLSAVQEGYVAATTTINPLVHPEGAPVMLKLSEEPKRPPRGGRAGRVPPGSDKPAQKTDDRRAPRQDDTGDMMQNPFK